jgi:hypothetical protein
VLAAVTVLLISDPSSSVLLFVSLLHYEQKLGIEAGLVFKPAQLQAGLLSWFELVCTQTSRNL